MTAAIQVKTWLAGDFTKSKYWKRIRPDGTYGLDVDGYYGGQCMDLIMAYGLDLFGWRPTGNAIALLDQHMPSGWKRSKTPVVGAIAVKDFVSGGTNYGHTYIVTAIIESGVKVQTLEQNAGTDWSLETGSAPHRYTRWVSEARIYLIPPLEGGDLMIIQNKDNWYARCNDTHVRMTSEKLERKVFEAYVGKDFLKFVEDVANTKSAAVALNWQKVGKIASQEKWVKPSEADKKLAQIKKIIG